MLSINDKISVRQLQVLLILDVFGTGVTVLPRRVADHAGQDGWMCVLLAMAAVAFFSLIMTSLAGRFPDQNFVEYTSRIMTRPVGILISVSFVIKIVVMTGLELRFFGEIIRQIMLADTPFTVICLSMLLLGGYTAAKGYETRARLAEILIFIVFLPILFVFAIAATDVDFSNLLPVMTAEPRGILEGSYTAIFAFSGIDFCLLAFPYLQRPKNARKAVAQSIILIGVFMTLITVVTIARFGPYDLKRQIWPVLEMMDTVNLPGSFLERQGALVMSFWMISVFAIVNAGLFFSSLLLRDICQKGKHSTYILIVIPIIFGISFLPKNLTETFDLYRWMNNTFGIAFFLFIPLILLIVAKLRKAGDSL